MRYSFHGKVRATGQTIDGFIEAASASLAIDKLADKGIIGVYSVRPDPKVNRDAAGAPSGAAGGAAGGSGAVKPNGLPDRRSSKSSSNGRSYQDPIPAVAQPVPSSQAALPAPASNDAATADLLKALAEKIAHLTGKVETMLAKPSSVIYQQGPARDRDGGARGPKRAPRIAGEQQSSTLRDIFQNNLDLRSSLEKLASSVGGPPVAAKATGAKEGAPKATNGSHPATNGSSNGNANGSGNGTPNGVAKPAIDPVSKPRTVVNPPRPA